MNVIGTTPSNDEHNTFHVYSGGDDQSLHVCMRDKARRLNRRTCITLTVLHSHSALKEVQCLDQHRFVAVGYSQRLVLWTLSDDSRVLKPTSAVDVEVGDVQGAVWKCFRLGAFSDSAVSVDGPHSK